MSEIAILCKTEDEWDRVKGNIQQKFPAWDPKWIRRYEETPYCLTEDDGLQYDPDIHPGYSSKEYWEKEGYKIISVEEYLNEPQTNNIKGEDKMGKTVIDADVKAEFGKEDGDTLVNVNDHLNDAMIRRYVMKTNHKEIVKECNDIEKKRLEAEKD